MPDTMAFVPRDFIFDFVLSCCKTTTTMQMSMKTHPPYNISTPKKSSIRNGATHKMLQQRNNNFEIGSAALIMTSFPLTLTEHEIFMA